MNQRLEQLRRRNNPIGTIGPILERIPMIKGDKGEPGSAVVGPQGPQGEPGNTPIKGEDYFTPQEIDEITALIQSRVKPGVPGKDGKSGATPVRGLDYWSKQDQEAIIRDVLSRIPKPKSTDVDYNKIVADAVAKALASKTLKIENVDGLGKTLGSLTQYLKRGGFRGGGGHVVAGTNISVTANADGSQTVSSTAVGGGQVNSVVAGTGISVNSTDPANPIVSATGGGTGTVTSVGSVDASVTVTNATTTPDLAVAKAPKWSTARTLAGNSVDGSANVPFANKFLVQGTADAGLSGAQFLGALGTGIVKNTTTTGVLSVAVAADFPTLNQNTSGNAATVTTNANLTGPITSSGNATTIASQTGTGTKFVVDTSPTLVTPALGVATATSINGVTIPSATDTAALLGTAQTYTATQTEKQVVWSNNAITAVANAATVPITSRLNTVTNNSAATLTITMATASAVDGQLAMVRVLDFSAAAQTLTWVNTENSLVSVPATSNGSTTLPSTVGFQFNGSTSKWRCIAAA